MITNKELTNVVLSPTKKDYYQIWAELLDLASKISDRWTPVETNESDPGVVLLKALTAIADKLNYNIDKNTLEAFMPSATQEESMRKLTEMMGYNMKYYQSATCKVRIEFVETDKLSWQNFPGGIYFPKFTNLTNDDEDINYITLESFKLYENEPYRAVYAIEGELVTCESDSDNVVSIRHLDDNNRYFLPEAGIAENGIFVTNISDNIEEDLWQKVDNLNTSFAGSKIFKFGIDSANKLPYVQFPEDISHLIKRGLKIQYVRTSGLNGNTSAGNLTKFTIPAEWTNIVAEDDPIKDLTEDNFKVKQITSGNNGANPESLNDAYNNYKKTIGTFDTLVTCRDYMNKIYQLTVNENSSTPLVSNIIVSDIRDDINNAITLCSFNDYGISYSNKSLKNEEGNNKIDHCDLILYPFKTIYGVNDEREYNNSFKYDASNNNLIESEINELKTISHKLRTPEPDDIICIKNYLQLKAQVYTYKKVSTEEGKEILANIRTRLFEKFNARQVDFGEEIPYNSLVEEIINADTRIKDINLDEPVLVTKICTRDNSEYVLASMDSTNSEEIMLTKQLYNKLVLRNVLAGRIAAFSYNNSFAHDYRDTKYSNTYELEYGPNESTKSYIAKLKSNFTVSNELATQEDNGIKLKENQVIQFRMPNLRTSVTYPAYVNYYFNLNNTSGETAYFPATMQTLLNFIQNDTKDLANSKFFDFIEANTAYLAPIELTVSVDDANERMTVYNKWINGKRSEYGLILTRNGTEGNYTYTSVNAVSDSTSIAKGTYTFYVLPLESSTLGIWDNWVTKTTTVAPYNLGLSGIYKNNGVDLLSIPGRLRDNLKQSYTKITTINTQHNSNTLQSFYIPVTHAADKEYEHTTDGLGRDGKTSNIAINSEYQLDRGEYLLINYTDSSTDENNVEVKTIINKYYGEGTIIRPNFELTNSYTYYTLGHSWTKKDGFNFPESSNPAGMFTLGTNEQIEVREIAKVKLDGTINLYWILNSDDLTNYSNEFKFNEKYCDNEISEPTGENEYNAYTLKEGEYLLYTDRNKTDFAYYGAGTIIVKENINQIKRFSTETSQISMSAIDQNWIESDIPWTTYTFNNEQAIYVIENQYISLTCGDTLNYASTSIIERASSVESPITLNNTIDSEHWEPVTSAGYTFAEGGTGKLPITNIHGITWKVKSRLDFNMSVGNPQTLHEGDEITAVYVDDKGRENESVVFSPITNGDETIPLTIQPNSLCLGAVDEINVTESAEIVDGEIIEKINKDFRLKITNRNDIITKNGSVLALNNYVNNDNLFTKYSFVGEPYLDINSKKFVVKESGRYLIKVSHFGQSNETVFLGKKTGEMYIGKSISVQNNTIGAEESLSLPEEDSSISIQNPYYLFGNFNNWKHTDAFKFKSIDIANMSMFIELQLVENDEFVIAKKYLKNVLDIFTKAETAWSNYISTNSHTKDFELNISLPENCFGLVMFYWVFDDNEYNTDIVANKIKAHAKIAAKNDAGNYAGLLKLNTTEENYQNEVTLQRGFNMIKIDSDVKKIEISGTCGNIIFDNLKIIKDANPLLDYQLWDTTNCTNILDQLLTDISDYGDVVQDFYYTAPILTNTAIELNPLITTDTLLKNPISWYDNNNVNNKFVISELDTEYLKTGITIARTSRR